MIRPALLPVLLATLAISCATSRAWDALGHMLVARIAYDQLTPAAKAGVDATIARFNRKIAADAPYDFITAACWMDDIRSQTKEYNAWHFADLPFTADGQPLPGPNAGPNALAGIQHCEDILESRTADPTIDQDQALVMLAHLVGDIHQPLHTISRGNDLGGNKVNVSNLQDPLSDLIFSGGGNLHFFWDSAYRRIYQDGQATVAFEAPLYNRFTPVAGHLEAEKLVRVQASALEARFPPSTLKTQGDAATWALESHAIGYNLAYGELPKAGRNRAVMLTQDYVDAAREAAKERIAFAGYRLGQLLNQVFAAGQR